MNFVVIETGKVGNIRQVPVILGDPFLATTNVLITCKNGMMRLTFGNMILEFDIFNFCKNSVLILMI